MNPSLGILLQWADSAYPTGGFAYSSGLEAMARLPAFDDLDDLRFYLRLVLDQVFAADLPYLMAMHKAATQQDTEGLARLAWEWDAFLHQPTLRRASLSQGEAWARLYAEGPGLTRPLPYGDGLNGAPLHWLTALALTASAIGLGPETLRDLHMHLVLRDQVAAAVRLGLLGANQAQALQTRVALEAHQAHAGRLVAAPEDAVRIAPVLETVQALHPRMYVKLFQN